MLLAVLNCSDVDSGGAYIASYAVDDATRPVRKARVYLSLAITCPGLGRGGWKLMTR